MANCLLCWPDHVQGTDYQTAVLSEGSWSTDLPLSNITDRALASLARSVDDANASTKFKVDLAIGRPVKVFTLLRHNISQLGKIRITGSINSDMSAPSYESGWLDVWPVFYAVGDLPWGYSGVWTGILSSEEIDGYTMQFIHVLPTEVWCRYWRIEIDDTTNVAGYVEFSRASLWSAWQPDVNMSYGAALGWDTDTPFDRALSGTDYFDRRNPRRVIKFTIPQITLDTALKKPFEMGRKLGRDGELFFIFDPEDAQDDMFRRSFLSTMKELSPLEYPVFDVLAQAFSLQEIL